jgi:arylsulfatase A-like enzyme
VEVTLAGWDDHGGATKQVNRRCAYMDGAIAALLDDLKQRGLLDTTLVCWMGEFGRAPGKGDGHYCQAWTSVLAGCGLKTGQVIGRTDKKGGTVEDRPISAPDFLATLCRALGIDYTKEYVTSEDRPLRIVEHGEKIVEELFA